MSTRTPSHDTEMTMSSMDVLDVGQANELKLASRRNGFTPEDLKWLCEGDRLALLREVRLGHMNIVAPDHIIDLSGDPFVPDGWSVVEHRRSGLWKWDPTKIEFYCTDDQAEGHYIAGDILRGELNDLPLCNANILDYLLAHRHLIPKKWRGKNPHFWGTIYYAPRGDSDPWVNEGLYVRCLGISGDDWTWGYKWFDGGFCSQDPAAIFIPA